MFLRIGIGFHQQSETVSKRLNCDFCEGLWSEAGCTGFAGLWNVRFIALLQTAVSGQQSATSRIAVFLLGRFPLLPKRRESEFPPTEKRSTLMWVFLSSIPCYFFIEKTTKIKDLYALKNPFGCMLFNNFNMFNTFKCFKGAMRPCHT